MAYPTKRVLKGVAAMAAVLVMASLAVAPVRADTKSELASAKAKLSSLIDHIAAMQSSVDSLQAELNALAARISAVQSRMALAQNRIAAVQKQIRAAAARLKAKQQELDQRAAIAYQNGPGTGFEFLLGSTSLADFNTRLEIIDRAAQSDEELMNEIRDRQNELRLRQVELRRLQVKLQGEQEQLAAQERGLQQKFAAQQAALQEIESTKAKAEGLVRELEEKRAGEIAAYKERLRKAAEQRERERLERERAQNASESESPDDGSAGADNAGSGGEGSGDDDSSGGTAPVGGAVFQLCPVDPPRAYSNDWLAPRVGHLHQGNDIFAPYGTRIRAPFSGTAFATNSSLGGLSVYVSGSQGFVYNAHLSALGTLGSVSAGTVIGYVGTSGNAQGTSPHDHFEWHPGGGAAVNPYPYLNQVC